MTTSVEIIRTVRLSLRRLARADAPEVARLIADTDITRWLTSVPWPYALEDAITFTEKVEADATDHFAICRDDAFLGVISTQDQLGYWLAKHAWGQGYMTEAAGAVIARHFRSDAVSLRSGYVLGNVPSSRILTKLGFRNSEIIEAYVPTLGRAASVQKMVLSRLDWEAKAA